MVKSVAIFVLSIIVNLTILPSFVLIYTVFVVYRFVVSKWAQLSTTLSSPLKPSDTLAFVGDTAQTGVVTVTLNGRVDADQLCESFSEKVLNRRNSYGELVYPKLHQSVSPFCGLLFWKDQEIEVRSHVELWSSFEFPVAVVTQEVFKGVVNSILKTDFEPNHSPWKLYVLHNTRISSDPPGIGNKTTVIFHFHRVLGGGVEFMCETVLSSWFDTEPTEGNGTEDSGTSWKIVIWRRFFKIVQFFLFGSYDFLKKVFENRSIDRVDWGVGKGTDLRIHISEPISTSMITDIRNVYCTSAVSVILGGFTGALRRFMIQHLIKIPGTAKCSVQVENDERNCQLTVVLPIDALPPFSSKERIQLLQRRLMDVSHSTEGMTTTLVQSVIGSLPTGILPKVKPLYEKFFSVDASLMTVSTEGDPKRILCNSEVVGILPLERFSTTKIRGPTLLCNNYGTSLQFILTVDSSLIPSSLPLKDLNTFIFKELEDLMKIDSVLYV